MGSCRGVRGRGGRGFRLGSNWVFFPSATEIGGLTGSSSQGHLEVTILYV